MSTLRKTTTTFNIRNDLLEVIAEVAAKEERSKAKVLESFITIGVRYWRKNGSKTGWWREEEEDS